MMMDKLSHSPVQSSFRLQSFRTIGLVVGLMLVSGGAGWWFSRSGDNGQSSITPASATAAPVPVKTAIARLQSINANRILTGTVEPIETVTLTSRVMGLIRQLPVQEGDRVNAGETLVVIDVADIQAQNGQAIAGVNMAQSNYLNTQGRLQEARAQLVETEAQLAESQLEQRRMSMLRSEGAVSQQLLDQANTRVQTTQSRLQQVQAGIRQSQAMMNQAQAQVSQAQAQVSQVSANLNYGTITAPFYGVVTHKHTEVGAMAGAGQSLLTLESSDRLRFTTQVPESLITQIRQGQKVSVRLDALNRDVSGTVSQIIPSADPATRNFTVKVLLNQTSAMIPGMFGRLQLSHQTAPPNASNRTALIIPQAAIVQQFGITGIYKVVNSHASFQPITTGKLDGADTEVFSGLTAGDRVILDPASNLKDGTPVQIK
jgi:HlyD family secretion protein